MKHAALVLLALLMPLASAGDIVSLDVPRQISWRYDEGPGSYYLYAAYAGWESLSVGYPPGGIVETYAQWEYCVNVDAQGDGTDVQNVRVTVNWGDGTVVTLPLAPYQAWTGCREFAPSLVPYAISAEVTAKGTITGRSYRLYFEDNFPSSLTELPTDLAAATACREVASDWQCDEWAEEPCDIPHVGALEDCIWLRKDVTGWTDAIVGAVLRLPGAYVDYAREQVNPWLANVGLGPV